ncbi:MAG TPA: hypothetical protein VHM90_04320, partial [Phycisphaerae bacterium]|nr:hypothetical protein [Phycisphaerae bacterium]
KEMPDPLKMNDGTKVTTVEQWQARRKEMIKLLEDYEYGHMPPPPGNVVGKETVASHVITIGGGRGGFGGPGLRGRAGTGTTSASAPATVASAPASGPALPQANYKMVHLSFGPEQKLGFDVGIFTPVEKGDAKGPFPILIVLGFGAGETSLGANVAALNRGYAVATIGYNQLGADAPNYRSTAFFPAYPEYDWNDFSAWAWGISRAVDYLVTDPLIDKDKIMVTGTSRTGQAAFLAGAFDERIALTAPVAGGMALRYSGKEVGDKLGQGIGEVVDQQTYWFGPRLPEFKGHTYQLPTDQHFLVALTAPRLFIMCNSMADQYGRPLAAVKTYEAAKPVFDFLKVPDHVGLSFRPGGHGMQAPDWSALLDFADQKLLKKPGDRKFDVIPPADELK